MSRNVEMEPVVDRRVARTRQTLRDALIRLVIERGWDAVSVKDVCEAANVGRSTFYVHFTDKEHLLTSGFEQLAAFLRERPDPAERPAGTVLWFVRPLFQHAHEHWPMFRALIGKQSGQVAQRRFRRLVLELVAEELGRPIGDHTVRFVAGGVVEVLSAGLDARSVRINELDAEVQALVGRVISPPGA